MFFGNAELTTSDHATYTYRNKGLKFSNGQPNHLRVKDVTGMTQEYSADFCVYLKQYDPNAVILKLKGVFNTKLDALSTSDNLILTQETPLGTSITLNLAGIILNRWLCLTQAHSY